MKPIVVFFFLFLFLFAVYGEKTDTVKDYLSASSCYISIVLNSLEEAFNKGVYPHNYLYNLKDLLNCIYEDFKKLNAGITDIYRIKSFSIQEINNLLKDYFPGAEIFPLEIRYTGNMEKLYADLENIMLHSGRNTAYYSLAILKHFVDGGQKVSHAYEITKIKSLKNDIAMELHSYMIDLDIDPDNESITAYWLRQLYSLEMIGQFIKSDKTLDLVLICHKIKEAE